MKDFSEKFTLNLSWVAEAILKGRSGKRRTLSQGALCLENSSIFSTPLTTSILLTLSWFAKKRKEKLKQRQEEISSIILKNQKSQNIITRKRRMILPIKRRKAKKANKLSSKKQINRTPKQLWNQPLRYRKVRFLLLKKLNKRAPKQKEKHNW